MTFSYAVDLELASSVVSSLSSGEAQLSEVVVDLRWRVDRLHTTWAGTAAAAHLEAHSAWEASYAEMHSALVVMRRCVRTAAESYAAAAEANVGMWSDVR